MGGIYYKKKTFKNTKKKWKEIWYLRFFKAIFRDLRILGARMAQMVGARPLLPLKDTTSIHTHRGFSILFALKTRKNTIINTDADI